MEYESCSECKRLMPYSPYENVAAPGYSPLYSYIDMRKVCWQCAEKLVAKLGVVPAKPRSAE